MSFGKSSMKVAVEKNITVPFECDKVSPVTLQVLLSLHKYFLQAFYPQMAEINPTDLVHATTAVPG